MAKSDVTVSVSGISLKPIGIEIVYAINSIPLCLIDLDAADPSSDAILNDPDSYKSRINTITVTCSIKGSTVTFTGFFDGISVSQSVGGLSYSVVLKGTAQILLECDSTVPGISPYGIDPFLPISTFDIDATKTNSNSGVFNSYSSQVNIEGTSIATAYQKLAIAALQNQTTPSIFSALQPNNPNIGGTTLNDLLESSDRIKKIQAAVGLINNMDFSAVAALEQLIDPTGANNSLRIIDAYQKGSRNLWENLLNYYDSIGCIFIIGKTKIWVVPNNGFITFPHSTPGSGQHSSITNQANPADYNAFNYNDNGYIDVGYIALLADTSIDSQPGNALQMYQGGYPPKGASSISPGAGVLVLDANPLLFSVPANSGNSSTYATGANANTPNKSTNASIGNIITNVSTTVSKPEIIRDTNINNFNSGVKSFGDKYAELMFYKSRYTDRTGSITLEYNPNWCPGTVGTLYTRKPGIFLDFFAQRIRHRITLPAPNSGTAITSVEFNCGRLGNNNVSVSSDPLYNYSYGDVQNIQSAFVGDIT